MHSNIYVLTTHEYEDTYHTCHVDEGEAYECFNGDVDYTDEMYEDDLAIAVNDGFGDISESIEHVENEDDPHFVVHLDRDKIKTILEKRIQNFKHLAADFSLEKFVQDQLSLFALKNALSDDWGFKVIDGERGSMNFDEWLMDIYAEDCKTVYVTQVFDYHV